VPVVSVPMPSNQIALVTVTSLLLLLPTLRMFVWNKEKRNLFIGKGERNDRPYSKRKIY